MTSDDIGTGCGLIVAIPVIWCFAGMFHWPLISIVAIAVVYVVSFAIFVRQCVRKSRKD